MSDTQPGFTPSSGSGNESLRSEVQSLSGLVAFSLLLMLIFTVAVNIFLYKQAHDRSIEAYNAQMIVNNYITVGETQARDFWMKLSAYAATHPDFAPVYNKWSQVITTHTNAPTAMPAPAPVKK